MISVEEAIATVKKTIKKTSKTEVIPLSSALGHILSTDVLSPINMPPFRQSAMDGYAIHLSDSMEYEIVSEIKAGDADSTVLKSGQAARIFTGAAVPDSANAIAIQEHVTAKNNTLTLEKEVKPAANIRDLGEQVKKGQLALPEGSVINAAAIGFLASLGISEVSVYTKPSVAIITTGNELVPAGTPLKHGEIYESNAIMLQATLNEHHYNKVSVFKVNDNFDETVSQIRNVMSDHDFVVITGGISVGDYDFVGKALEKLQVNQLFYEVKQKPGKPLYFGKKEGTIIFALPGNPAASLSCFYIYVLLALELSSGNRGFSLPRIKARSRSDFYKKGDRAQFLKAYYEQSEVSILDGQSSSMLHTFAIANSLVYVPSDKLEIRTNEAIDVIMLPIK
jgi:molybdopterin molybdotransferase